MLKLLSKENIENQALQMELNEAVQYEDSQLVEQLRFKVWCEPQNNNCNINNKI